MKTPKPFLFLIAALLALGALHPANARAQVSVNFFYQNLQPYGEWVQDPDYGYCWHPSNVDDNWAPYTDGYWAYTDGGWTWVSYEDYGGIVYHYGRWAHIPGEGWVWVPGTTWAPAWVSWRTSDDYVGWAPLPPEARWRVGFGFGGGVDAQFDIGPGFYSFVNIGDFGAPALGAVILHRDRNVTIINQTTNITNITVNNSNVYTGGPSYAKMAARSTRPIPTLKLVRQGDSAALHGAGGKFLSHQTGSSLVVLAPKVTPSTGGKFPVKVTKTLTGVKADNGWAGTDPQARTALETKFKSEGGAETAAKPVKAEDLKIVTDKVKTPPKALVTATPKPKAAKTKTESTTDLLNAPATEESTPAPTPKTVKSKKSHALATPAGDNGNPDETPVPKVKKARKAKTPVYDESTPAETPSHATSDNPDLHPFVNGDTGAPKAAYSDEGGAPKGGPEPQKKKKKGKGEGSPTPPQ